MKLRIDFTLLGELGEIDLDFQKQLLKIWLPAAIGSNFRKP